jgi:hypothetical protein
MTILVIIHRPVFYVERQREEKVGEGGPNKICGFEGSQAGPASPSGRGETCMRDLFFNTERERGESWGGSERHYRVGGGV